MNKPLDGCRVLVVEDEMLVLMNTEDMLGDLGCEDVRAAATVAQALAQIAATDFDASLLDMNLNGEKTGPVAEALAARNIPFAYATGYVGPGTGDAFADRPVLHKPFNAGSLERVITGLLADRKPA